MITLTIWSGRLVLVDGGDDTDIITQIVRPKKLYDFYDILEDNEVDIISPEVLLAHRYTDDEELVQVLSEFRCIWIKLRLNFRFGIIALRA